MREISPSRHSKPLVSLILLSYNQEVLIQEAVEGALAQDYPNLEIIISDDFSNDATLEIIRSVVNEYKDTSLGCGYKHNVVLNQNSENMGLVPHFNKIMELVSGDIVVLCAGDDVSLPTRVSKTVDVFERHSEVMLVSFTDNVIDASGIKVLRNHCEDYSQYDLVTLEGFLGGGQPFISGASRSFRIELYKTFGPLSSICPTEDTPYKLRGLLMGKACIFRAPGIYYRKHAANLSGDSQVNYMSFSAIAGQCYADIEVAWKAGFVSEVEKEKCAEFVERDKRKRVIQKDIYEKRFSFVYVVKNIICNRDFVWREKLMLVKKILFFIR